MNILMKPPQRAPRSTVGLHAPSGFDPNAPRVGALSTGAPVCPITRSEVPPGQPGIKVPSVPRANDLDSAIKAINDIILILNEASEPTIRWLEDYRVTQIVRIHNPDDFEQWVEVERITKLVMKDQINGDLWVWELGDDTPPSPAPPTLKVPPPVLDNGRWKIKNPPPPPPGPRGPSFGGPVGGGFGGPVGGGFG